MGLFEGPFNWGFDGLYHWLQLASYDQYVAGGGCESQNAYYFWGYHQSEDCTGSFCCSLEEECSNRDGTWESSWCECSASPIIVDLGGDGFALTSGEKGVAFDLWANGGDSKVAWTSGNSDDAFLVLDRNQNGLIDDGTELFGNVTDQPAPVPPKKRNGFAALAVFDLDADGAITARDSAYSSLALWRDRNHNGVSETSELQSLSASGLVSLTVEYRENRRKDGFGNEFRYGAKFVLNTGRTVWAYDVFLRGARDLSGQ